jgi:hypothetical protein
MHSASTHDHPGPDDAGSNSLLLKRIASTLAFVGLGLTMAACGAPTPEQSSTWRETSAAENPDSQESDRSHLTHSLGDPFVLVANQAEPGVLAMDLHLNATDLPTASTQSVWLMLSSDACDVELVSLNIAFQSTDHGSDASLRWLATSGSSTGVVVDASPSHAVVRYDLPVRISRGEANWSEGQPFSASIELEAHKDGDHVWLNGKLHATDPSGNPIRLRFGVMGSLSQDLRAIPSRRWACPN